MKKLLILSDLHLMALPVEEWGAPDHDLVIIAGDVVSSGGVAQAKDVIIALGLNKKPVVFVPGNHEYYHMNMLDERYPIVSKRDNIYVLDGYGAKIEGIPIWGGTMWTDFCLYGAAHQAPSMFHAQKVMNDYRMIRYGKIALEPAMTLHIHRQQKIALQKYLSDNPDAIVITHTAPSRRSTWGKYSGDPANPAFASNLEHIAAQTRLWVHGHTHTFCDYQIGDCRVVCNPVGYPGENTGYRPGFAVEV